MKTAREESVFEGLFYFEGLLLKDVIAEALNAYVNKWEEVNRKIRLPKVK